jgi:hypothetical protein
MSAWSVCLWWDAWQSEASQSRSALFTLHNRGCISARICVSVPVMVTWHGQDAARIWLASEAAGFHMRSESAGGLRARAHHRARTPGLEEAPTRARQPPRSADRSIARAGSVVHGRTARSPRAKPDCRPRLAFHPPGGPGPGATRSPAGLRQQFRSWRRAEACGGPRTERESATVAWKVHSCRAVVRGLTDQPLSL